MDYKSFINGIAMQSGRTTDSAEAISQKLIEIFRNSFCDLDEVAIPAFGTFKPEKHDEYIASDLSDGSLVCYPPSISLSFTPSTMLKKHLRYE